MSNNIDDLPLYDPLTSKGDTLSDIWLTSMASFVQTLQGYLTGGGILVPQLTNRQRDELRDVQNGQLIYNISLGKFQGYEAGAWVNLV